MRDHPPGKPIRLTRRFALVSAVVILVAAVAVAAFGRMTGLQQLEGAADRDNVHFGQMIANVVWPGLADFHARTRTLGPEEIRLHPQTARTRAAVVQITGGTPVLKVKLRTLDGQTVFSTDTAQIISDFSDHDRFKGALLGNSGSLLEYRVSFNAISGPLRDRYVVSSYVPIAGANGAIEGVAEIYRDVTHRYHETARQSLVMSAAITGAALSVFGVLLLLVWRADRQIQDHHEYTLELTASVARAEAASRAKSDFVAMISHELRTPLNAMLGFAQIMKIQTERNEGSEKHREYVDHICECGEHVLQIVNEVLDLSKVEAGELNVVAETVDVGAVAREIVRMVRQSNADREVGFALSISPEAPPIETDRVRLRQILLNLVANAAKFTPEEGMVQVAVRTGASAGLVQVLVTDTGIGIEPKDIPTVLSAFGQVDSELARNHNGAGLGLPLSRKLAELLGGSLWLESEPGIGTTVTVSLPPRLPQRVQSIPDDPVPARSVA